MEHGEDDESGLLGLVGLQLSKQQGEALREKETRERERVTEEEMK